MREQSIRVYTREYDGVRDIDKEASSIVISRLPHVSMRVSEADEWRLMGYL